MEGKSRNLLGQGCVMRAPGILMLNDYATMALLLDHAEEYVLLRSSVIDLRETAFHCCVEVGDDVASTSILNFEYFA